MKRPVSYLSGVLAFTLLVGLSGLTSPTALLEPAQAKPEPKEWAKYLNPVPQKNYTLNKSQDREIKKKGFKTLQITGAQAVTNKEIGLFARLNPSDRDNSELVNKLLEKPEVNGLSANFSWRELNPEDDKFEWKKLDDLLALVGKHDKTLILRVTTCGTEAKTESDTPEFVLKKEVKTLAYKDAAGTEHKMPIFWDSTYLAEWGNFVQEFGKRYDKNPNLHSVGITGGGVAGGTLVVPELSEPLNQENYKALEKTLTKEHGMSQRQLVEHWKYVADIFPKAFPTARLNFDINPPTPNRAGQDSLDEISDYLIYRYGQRVYLTRMHVNDAKHGFDQYRVMLKFRPDTLTGFQLTDNLKAEDLPKVEKNAFDDGASFVEVPTKFFLGDASKNETEPSEAVKTAMKNLREHLGYQIVSQKVSLPEGIKAGDPIKMSFTFANIGAATAMRPVRSLDKDVASSYRLQIEMRDETGKAKGYYLHTPTIPTNKWVPGKPITWECELKPTKGLKPGEYTVYVSLLEPESKRRLNILNGLSQEPKMENNISVGKIKVE
ncbi:MAG: DUF4832 domain-containing protein [Candidatus Obscuribacter sp.]|nr:DUF4832 domain-containing protein [Candidatus Obscuribacter sp.]MBK9277021.1 DUF4832 domain-containing protein [Candidatus Obscuribacter sp.]